MSKKRRPGKTETFSISIDTATKKTLRELADRDFGGNMSALVTDFANEARRRQAAGRFLRRHGIPALTEPETEKLLAEIEAEAEAWKRRLKKRRVG